RRGSWFAGRARRIGPGKRDRRGREEAGAQSGRSPQGDPIGEEWNRLAAQGGGGEPKRRRPRAAGPDHPLTLPRAKVRWRTTGGPAPASGAFPRGVLARGQGEAPFPERRG